MLHTLENNLLEALSNSEAGNILNNAPLIKTLETIKTESAQIQIEMD